MHFKIQSPVLCLQALWRYVVSSTRLMQIEELMVFARPEDEFYNKHCMESFTFSTNRTVEKDELVPLRLVMLLTAEQIATAR